MSSSVTIDIPLLLLPMLCIKPHTAGLKLRTTHDIMIKQLWIDALCCIALMAFNRVVAFCCIVIVDWNNPDCARSDVLGWGTLSALSGPITDGLVQRRSSHVVNGASSALQSPAAMSCEGDLTKIAVYSPAAGRHGLHIPRQRMRLRLTRGKEGLASRHGVSTTLRDPSRTGIPSL